MLLTNTRTAQLTTFPIPTHRPVTLYVCGVTPYATTHIGHARTYLIFDILIRYLRACGAEVHYCQNVTDVDDPLFERAEQDGIPWQELAEREVAQYLADCAALHMLPPTYFPRASQEIDQMIVLIEQLLALGHAYRCAGNIYFDVRSDPSFGSIAHLPYDAMLATANQRGNNPDDPNKRDPLDFVLWQTGKPGDPTWPSPWGPGRPGWHIECSAMAMRYLGPQIDIHGGGADLIFPHHACEIAQVEPITQKPPFAHIWMHAGLVWLDGEKMSKSLGNLVFVRDVLTDYSADALRCYLLSFPYREEFTYEQKGVHQAEQWLKHLRHALEPFSNQPNAPLDVSRGHNAFLAALDHDLNTPLALDILRSMTQDVLAAATEGRSIQSAQHSLKELATILGLQV